MSSSALAADILEPVVPVEPLIVEEAGFSWTGFYAGVNAGWGFAGSVDFENEDRQGSRDVLSHRFRSFGNQDDLDLNGPFAGAQIGANYQTGLLVLGIETDLQWSGIDADDDGGRSGNRSNEAAEVNWFGTARLRAGVAVDRALLYATGGFAYGHVTLDHNLHHEETFRFNPAVGGVGAVGRGRRIFDARVDHDATEWGFVLGGGVEYAFTDNVTAGVEYQYVNLGSGSADGDNGRGTLRTITEEFTVSGEPIPDTRREIVEGTRFGGEPEVDFHTARLKLNFLF